MYVFTHLYSMRESVGHKVIKALKTNDDAVVHAAMDMLCALMQVCCVKCGDCATCVRCGNSL